MKTYSLEERSQFIKQIAQREGFAYTRIAKAEFMAPEAKRLEAWLQQGFHGKMTYLENHFDLRVDPTKLVPDAKSVICLIYNYFPPEKPKDPDAPKIARYAFGKDYHWILKPKLKNILEEIKKKFGDVQGRVFVDSAPVLERDWARRSGLGWVGKNTLLIHPKKGSFFFLAEIIIDLKTQADPPITDFCGTCTRCIDACPTDAIQPKGYVLEADKCISYFTIELKESIPLEMKGKFENWMFGCDICQEVCPWNRFSSAHEEPAFQAQSGILEMSKKEWMELTEDTFKKIFPKSAVKRTKYSGLKRNINFLYD